MNTPAKKLRSILSETLEKLRNGEIKVDDANAIARNADSQTRIAVAELKSARQSHSCDFFLQEGR